MFPSIWVIREPTRSIITPTENYASTRCSLTLLLLLLQLLDKEILYPVPTESYRGETERKGEGRSLCRGKVGYHISQRKLHFSSLSHSCMLLFDREISSLLKVVESRKTDREGGGGGERKGKLNTGRNCGIISPHRKLPFQVSFPQWYIFIKKYL